MSHEHGSGNGNGSNGSGRKKAEREQVVLVPSSYDRDAARVTAARTRALFAQLVVDGDDLAPVSATAPPRKH